MVYRKEKNLKNKSKNHELDNKRKSNKDQIKKITWIGILVNIFLAGIKFLVGYLGESKAVIADAFHSLSDLSTDFAILFGIRFWAAPPDEDHPYGHGRIESIVTIVIGLILASVAVGIGYKAVIVIGKSDAKQVGWVALIGPLFSIVFKEFLYYKTKKIGIKTKSSALIANAWHHRSDSISSIPVLIAVIASSINPDWKFLDNIGALLVSAFILKVSWDIIKSPLYELTDKSASEAELKEIEKISEKIDGVKEVHSIRTRKSNSNIYVDLHVLVDPEMSVRDGHHISDQVRLKLLDDGPGIVDVVVHLEPYEKT